ncbi:Pycsar system effector family protein [Winogradskyella litorisediminis]|uniref:Pycsar system effector family protein n=1 Tax=Winogradskyella litorisediminis TaxID=1156618 RepID=A0ABW3N8D7_9FLAO
MSKNIPNKKIKTPDDVDIPKTNDLAFHYWHTLKHHTNLIKASELKAGLILSFYGILLNFVYKKIDTTMQYMSYDWIMYILLILWFLTTVISIYYSVRSFIPRIEKKYDSNVFFFGDIISKFGDVDDFSQTFYDTAVDIEKRYEQLGQQVYIHAKITATKFKYVNKSLRFLAYGLALLLVIIVTSALSVLF